MNDELVPVNVVTANTAEVVVPTVRFCMYALVAVKPVAERFVVDAVPNTADAEYKLVEDAFVKTAFVAFKTEAKKFVLVAAVITELDA